MNQSPRSHSSPVEAAPLCAIEREIRGCGPQIGLPPSDKATWGPEREKLPHGSALGYLKHSRKGPHRTEGTDGSI